MTPTLAAPLWLIDRSRVVDGRGFCERARYLGYHSGPTGYGIARKATKLPLMTGIAAHEGLAPILDYCREVITSQEQVEAQKQLYGGQVVPSEVVRVAVQAAQARYWATVEARGFAYLQENEEVRAVTREQNYLIEGLIWAWVLEVLPEVLARGRVVEVEHDDTYVFDCTCGLGDGVLSLGDHEARGCGGKGLMCRPDFLLETWQTLELEYHEFKTTGMDNMTFRDKWEVMVQLFAATLDAERRLEKHVQSIYIHGLVKGKRGGEYNPETGKYDGIVRQQSLFCYGYRKPAVPPMEPETWAALYEYFDPYEQKNKRLPKAFRKAGVWELPDDYLAEGMSKAEYWVKWIPAEARRKNLVVLGPFSRQTMMVDHFLQEAGGEEDRWQRGLWQLWEVGQRLMLPHLQVDPQTGEQIEPNWWDIVWRDPEYQAAIDRLFPRSYECRRYGARSRCQFEGLCFYHEGWSMPLESGAFIDRRPHHKDELEQAIARGLLLPEEGAAEDEEQELS